MIASNAVYADDVSSVKGMLQKSVQAEDRKSFEAILGMALMTWPDKRMDILQAAEAASPDWMQEAHTQEIKADKDAKIAAETKSRARGVMYYLDPKLWNGQAEVGAGSSTGDTDEKSLSIGLGFHRDFGPDWEHDLAIKFDFARSRGETRRQKFVTTYETLWRPWSAGFLVNYTELELDRFSGFDYRIVENIGLGFKVFDTKKHVLRVEGGPGLRFSKLEETGLKETEFLGRLSGTYDWKISDTMTLRDRASVIFASKSTTIQNGLQLSAQLNSHLTARLSFDVEYDSDPPVNTSAWDTSTRATLVYGF